MKVLVIGSTGATGRIGVTKLLALGHDVTAFVRDPAKLTLTHPKLRLAIGDARDAASLEAALAGQDAVFSALGPRSFGKDDLQEVFMHNLVAGMQKQGVRRLVNLSAIVDGEAHMKAPWIVRALVGLLLRNIFDDKKRGEVYLYASSLDYVNVKPGRLLNSPARGGVKANLDGKNLGATMTRADLADFMVAQLDKPDWVRRSPVIGY